MAELVRQELGKILIEELQDPRIGFVTVTRVEMSADLRAAKVFVSVMGEHVEQRTTLRGLDSAQQHMRSALSQRLNLRRTPELLFYVDKGVKRSVKMSAVLSKLTGGAQEKKRSSKPERSDSQEEGKRDAD